MTTKIQQVKNAVSHPGSFAEVCSRSGLPSNLVGVYLSILQKRGDVTRVGERGSYIYSARGGATAGTFPAEQDRVGGESGDSGGNRGEEDSDATWPGAAVAAKSAEEGAA